MLVLIRARKLEVSSRRFVQVINLIKKLKESIRWLARKDLNLRSVDDEEVGENRSVAVSGRIVTGFSGGERQGNRTQIVVVRQRFHRINPSDR
jgi:hypothetical protein